MHSFLRWLRAPLCAILVAAPLTLGVVWRHQTDERRQKLDSVCAVLVSNHDEWRSVQTYLGKFVTTQQGKDFVAGLPVPPKPDC